MKFLLSFFLTFGFMFSYAQSPFNIRVTNPEAELILSGNYNPGNYFQAGLESNPNKMACLINHLVSPDSLLQLLIKLETFHNRNTYSDTLSNTTGIGATRKWVYEYFERISGENYNRLITSYLEFEMPGSVQCGAGKFKNIFAVLPGTDTSHKEMVIIEAHLDSRCENGCNITCYAAGMDDNGSGTALVLELARAMSRFIFPRTIVFMATVGEEQGLFGAKAFADYAINSGWKIMAVQNNDIVGGIICGETSSPPSCPADNNMDSTILRIFSFGNVNSKHKAYARFVKMMYHEKLLPVVQVPIEISIQIPEDRTGRGGDHIPFRQNGFTAIRFTSVNEHGHGDPSQPGYADRQHTTNDILGIDTNGDLVIDSFFVDMNYLARNTVVNGVSAAMTASAPEPPNIQAVNNTVIEVINPGQYLHYRIGIRTTSMDFDAVYAVRDTQQFTLPYLQQGTTYRVSIAAVNLLGVMSLFSNEVSINPNVNTPANPLMDTVEYFAPDCVFLGINDYNAVSGIIKTSCYPNPFQNEITFLMEWNDVVPSAAFHLSIHDISGKTFADVCVTPPEKMMRIELPKANSGLYFYRLRYNEKTIQLGKIVNME